MPRDTRKIEGLLSSTKANRAVVRQLIEKEGASLQHVYDQLGEHEQQFTERLKELQEWNKREAADAEAKAKADAEAKAKADAEAKAKAEAPAPPPAVPPAPPAPPKLPADKK